MSQINLDMALNNEAYARRCYVNYYRDKNTMDISPEEMSQITRQWSSYVKSWVNSAQDDVNDFVVSDYDYNTWVKEGYSYGQNLTGYNNSTGQKWAQYAGTYGRYAVNGANALVSGGSTGVSWLDGATSAAKGATDKINWTKTYKFGGKSGKTSSSTPTTNTNTNSTNTVPKDSGFTKNGSTPGMDGSELDTADTSINPNGGGDGTPASGSSSSAAKGGGAENAEAGNVNNAGGEANNAGGETELEVDWMLVAQVALDTVNTVTYQIQDPNAKETKALEALTPEMATQQGITAATKDDLGAMDDELLTMAEDASVLVNDEANPQIEQTYTDTFAWSQEYEHLQSELTRTGQLSQEQADLMQVCADNLAAGNEQLSGIQEEAQDTVNSIYDDMGTFQDGFDTAADNTATTQGVTDYAADFDERTKSLCDNEAVSQGMAAGSAGVHAGKAIAKVFETGGWGAVLYGGLAVVAGADAIFDVAAAAEQVDRSKKSETEIAARKTTQDMNVVTKEVYDTNVANYDVYMEDVAGLELKVPDEEIPVPEGEGAVATASPAGGSTGANPFGLGTDEDGDEDDPNKRRPEGLV